MYSPGFVCDWCFITTSSYFVKDLGDEEYKKIYIQFHCFFSMRKKTPFILTTGIKSREKPALSQEIKKEDWGIRSACFFFETSNKLHMPRSLRAWIHRLTALFFLPFCISSSPPVILLYLKKIRRNIYRLWLMFHIPFRSHISTVSLYLELASSVYPDENHWTVVRLPLDLLPGTSLAPSNRCVFMQSQLLQPRSQALFIVVNSKEDLGMSLKQSLMYNFLSVPATTNTKTCKELSQNKACSFYIGTQYSTDLHGIALKNNELNVTMADIRHWGLLLSVFCI